MTDGEKTSCQFDGIVKQNVNKYKKEESQKNIYFKYPEINKHAARIEAEMILSIFGNSLSLKYLESHVIPAINNAKDLGNDVSDLEDKIPQLQKDVAKRAANKKLEIFENSLSLKYLKSHVIPAIIKAKDLGNNVSDLEDKIRGLLNNFETNFDVKYPELKNQISSIM